MRGQLFECAMPPPFALLLLYLLAINAATVLAFWLDKHYARQSLRRIPESGLHALALIGGTPGAFYAMRKFRHKTRKRSFRARFWLVVAVQICAGLYGLRNWLLAL